MVMTHGLRLKQTGLQLKLVAIEGLGLRTRELMAVTAGTDALQLKGCD